MLDVSLGPALVAFTGRREGDLGSLAERGPDGPGPACEQRRRAVVDRPWTWLRQVHGNRVVAVAAPGHHAGAEADAAVTRDRDAALAVLTADCAPVALASRDGMIGVAHAGWRGLMSGVIAAAVAAMRADGARDITAALGPCIRAECYEFGPDDLDRVAAVLGDGVRSTTASGTPALDVPAAVAAALAAVDVPLVHDSGSCTACEPERWYSFRARAEDERQATVAWLP